VLRPLHDRRGLWGTIRPPVSTPAESAPTR
jgi:hypothetical protein